MINGLAANRSENHAIDYRNLPQAAEATQLFSDMLTIQLENEQESTPAADATANEETTAVSNTAESFISNNISGISNTDNNTGTDTLADTASTANSTTYDYAAIASENAPATAFSNSGLDTNTLLLCMMMGGGFGGLASALAMGALLGDDSTLDTLKGLFQSGSISRTTGETLSDVGSSVSKAVAGALKVPYNAWEKTTPGVVSNEGDRDASLYRQVIEQFDVENNGRYTVNKQGYGDTYCNIFMWDVTSAMGAEIPHYINKQTNEPTTAADPNAIEMTANSTYDWLHEYGEKYGWKKVDEQTAQAYANQGMPAVSIYKASGHGHAQIISPSQDGGYDATRGAAIAQAGRKLYDYAYTSNVYSQNTRENKVAYFVHA